MPQRSARTFEKATEGRPGRAMSTGLRIREARLSRGIAQAALARMAGISPSYLNLIEHERRAIGGALVNRLASALGVPASTLSEEADEALAQALRATAAAQGMAGGSLEEAGDVARRHPAWARAVIAQDEAMAAQTKTIEALSDRLTHDPTLASALHELLSTVSVVRSTAAILAQTPDLDHNWLGRFHANLDTDSRRLAEGAEAVMAYFDRAGERTAQMRLPAEVAARFLESGRDARAFEALERGGPGVIPQIVAELPEEAAALAAETLRAAAADAAGLPAALVDAAKRPDELLAAAGGDLALVLRRMAARRPGSGLVVCDAAGAIVDRRAVVGFPLPAIGAGCPLWPLYEALSMPGRPLRTALRTPDGARWLAHAVAQPIGLSKFDAPRVLRATMLVERDDMGATEDRARPVGPGCRVCPRPDCFARREPSVLSQVDGTKVAVDIGAPIGHDDPLT